MKKTLNPFEELLVGLSKAGVEFITVGALACAFNGYLRATEDVDILIKRNPTNIQKLLSFLSHYGQGFGSELNEADFSDEEGAIRVIEEFPIDIFVVMGGNHYEQLECYVEKIFMNGFEVAYLSKEGLIELKKESVREKDKLDVLALKKLPAKYT